MLLITESGASVLQGERGDCFTNAILPFYTLFIQIYVCVVFTVVFSFIVVLVVVVVVVKYERLCVVKFSPKIDQF